MSSDWSFNMKALLRVLFQRGRAWATEVFSVELQISTYCGATEKRTIRYKVILKFKIY